MLRAVLCAGSDPVWQRASAVLAALFGDIQPPILRRAAFPNSKERLAGRNLSIRSRLVRHDVANRDAEVAARRDDRFLRAPTDGAGIWRRAAANASRDLFVAEQPRGDVGAAEVDRFRIAVLLERGTNAHRLRVARERPFGFREALAIPLDRRRI